MSGHSFENLRLCVVAGARPTTVSLRLPTVIGRGRDAKIKVRHSLVSRTHCELFEFQGLLCLRDAESANGTFLNGERIKEVTAIRSGDELRVGNVVFRLEWDSASDESSTSPSRETATFTKEPTRGGEEVAEQGPTPSPASEALSVDDDDRVAFPFLQSGEDSQGSFIGIFTGGDLPPPVADWRPLASEEPSPVDASRIEIRTGSDASPTPKADDSALRRFLKGES